MLSGCLSYVKNEFPEIQNSKQYVDQATQFINNPPSGTLKKIRPNGDMVLYNEKTNTFSIKNSKGEPRTMFKPSDGRTYFDKQ